MLAPERNRQKGKGGEQKSGRGEGRSVLTEGRAERTLISRDMQKDICKFLTGIVTTLRRTLR
jgi:hypothetical protein